jgi:hypothetical protein
MDSRVRGAEFKRKVEKLARQKQLSIRRDAREATDV